MNNSTKTKTKFDESLAYMSFLEGLPNGDFVADLKLKISDSKYEELSSDIWEIVLDSVYYNVSDQVRSDLNKYVDEGEYEELANYLVAKVIEEPLLLDFFDKGLALAVKTVAIENNIKF